MANLTFPPLAITAMALVMFAYDTSAMLPSRSIARQPLRMNKGVVLRMASELDTSTDGQDGFVDPKDRAVVERTTRLMEQFIERDRKQRKQGDVEVKKKSKRFRFSTTVSASTTVYEFIGAPLTLDDYMGLPLDEYILLDERIVSRTKDGFHFTLPFGAIEIAPGKKLFNGVLGGADALRAECDLTVDSNARTQKNTIRGSNFRVLVDEEALADAKAQSDADRERLKTISKIMKPVAVPGLGVTAGKTVAKEAENLRQAAFSRDGIALEEQNATTLSPGLMIGETVTEKEEKRRQMIMQKRAEARKKMESIEKQLGALSAEEREELDKTASRKIIKGLDGAAVEAEGAVVLQWGKSVGRRSMGRMASLFSGSGNSGATTTTLRSGAVERPLTAKLTLNAELTLGVPIPRVILNPLGSLVLRLAFGQVLPRVLRIVGQDYERRASASGQTMPTHPVDGGLLGSNVTSSVVDWRPVTK